MRLDALAAATPAGSGGLIYMPWLNGEKTPVDSETLRGGFLNLSLTSTREHMVRAVYEGVAMNTRWLLGHLERFVGRRMDPLAIIGGGAQSDLWCQIFADVLQRSVKRVVEPRQANARGAAFITAMALGRMSVEDIPARARIERVFEPQVDAERLYDECFRRFLDAHRSTRGLYERIARKLA